MKKSETLNLFPSSTPTAAKREASTKRMGRTDTSGGSSDAETLWARCLEIIRDNVSEQVFKTWFEQISPQSWDGTQLTARPAEPVLLRVDRRTLFPTTEEDRTKGTWREGQAAVSGGGRRQAKPSADQRTIKLPAFRKQTQQPLPFDATAPTQAPEPSPTAHFPTYFNPRYTFENFIRGENNQLATSAAMAVADNPGKTRYNPLVIYGPTGLGKTHLVQAIGNRVLQRNRNARVLYTNSEKFTMEYINAIQTNRLPEFTNFYRTVDVLVVDDIQFLGGKERTQDMFFHTFNALHQAGKQVVLTSDKQPKDLADVDERLISRFQWGLTADIQPPDFETRMAILQQKAQEEGVEIPGDIMEYIARHVTTSVREIEGCLISLLAKVSLDNRDLTLDLAKEVVRTVSNANASRQLTIDEIKQEVSAYYNQPLELLSAKTRKHEVVLARQMCMYLAKQMTQMSLKSIGMHFGGRDHTTVLHSCQQIMNYIDTDRKIRSDVDYLKKALRS